MNVFGEANWIKSGIKSIYVDAVEEEDEGIETERPQKKKIIHSNHKWCSIHSGDNDGGRIYACCTGDWF